MTVIEQGTAPVRYTVSRKLNLFLAKKLRVPRVPAIKICRTVNRALNPFASQARSRRSRQIVRQIEPDLQIDPKQGYRFLNADDLPLIKPAIKQAREIYKNAGGAQSADQGMSAKAYMMDPADPETISKADDIMRLILSRPLLDAAAKYLGEVPILSRASVVVSLPSTSQIGSQLYHLDFADDRQVKLFVYVDDVSDENGPFTFVPIEGTKRLIKTLGYDRGRLSIKQVDDELGRDGQIKMTGAAGTSLLVDTSRCMHFGSNRNKKPRVVLLIQYVSHSVPEHIPTRWPVEDLKKRLDLDDVQTMALTL